ncbi:MAG: outer membrane lipoprotein carrier protein LolA [Bacteroidales bacterium]|nr:outer membrane lipoprotein carrier protein LolA [Bacteroidales bacterium]
MKRIAMILLCGLLTAASAFARVQTPEQAKGAVLAFCGKVAAVHCDFRQEKTSALLKEPAVSSGSLSYRKPDRLVWAYSTPEAFALVAEEGRLFLEKAGERKALEGNQGKMLREMTRMIVGSIDGRLLTDEKAFTSEFTLSGGEIVVTLIPKKQNLRSLWKRLELTFDRDSLQARSFTMHEASGDQTCIRFTHLCYEFSE